MGKQYLDLILHLGPAQSEGNIEYLCRYNDSDCSIHSDRFGKFTSTQQFAVKVIQLTKRNKTISSRKKFTFHMPNDQELHKKYIYQLDSLHDKEDCRVRKLTV